MNLFQKNMTIHAMNQYHPVYYIPMSPGEVKRGRGRRSLFCIPLFQGLAKIVWHALFLVVTARRCAPQRMHESSLIFSKGVKASR